MSFNFPCPNVQNSSRFEIPDFVLDELKNLYIYSGEAHPHDAQKPEIIEFAKLNKKNNR